MGTEPEQGVVARGNGERFFVPVSGQISESTFFKKEGPEFLCGPLIFRAPQRVWHVTSWESAAVGRPFQGALTFRNASVLTTFGYLHSEVFQGVLEGI